MTSGSRKIDDEILLLGCSNGLLTASQLSIGEPMINGFKTLPNDRDDEQTLSPSELDSRKKALKMSPLSTTNGLTNTLDEYLRTSQFGLSSKTSALDSVHKEDRL